MNKQVIICVDDEIAVLDALKVELKEAIADDYLIEIAEGGEEALELTKKLLKDGDRIPLIISDYLMPDIKGDELLKQIHALSSETFKVMLTGQANLEAVGNAIKYAKLYRYIAKPWQSDDLQLTVKEAIESYWQKQKLAEQAAQLQQMNQALQELNGEQTAAIEALKKAEEKYRSIFENAFEGIFQTSIDGRFISANPALAHNLGYDSPEELMATVTDMRHQLYVDPHRRDEFVALMRQDDLVSGFEAEGYRKDGSTIWVSINARAVRDVNGQLLYFQGFILHITERKQAQKLLAQYNQTLERQVADRTLELQQEIADRQRAEVALQDSETRFRQLASATFEAIAIAQAGKLLDVNQTFADMFGYDLGEVMGMHSSSFLPPGDWEEIERRLGLRDEGPYECLCVRKDGTSFPTEVRVRFMSAGDRTIDIAAIRDITERKRIEEILIRSRDFYLALFDSLPGMIWRAGLDAKCDYFNQAWLDFTGRTLDREMGDGWLEGIHPDDLERCANTYRQAFQVRQPFNMEYRLRDRAGEYRWISDTGRPFDDLNGNFSGYIGFCYDLTTHKQAEEASILAERNRMAREIHDTLAQAFTGIALQVEAVSRMSIALSEPAQVSLIQIYDLARSGLSEARRSVKALRPQLLEKGDLPSAIARFVAKMNASASSPLVYRVVGEPYPLPLEVENNLLRIGQEAATNAIKHAKAEEISIELIYEPSRCILQIKDNGRGFVTSDLSVSKGFGLIGMKERARSIAAHLSIQSHPGRGTEVVAIVERS
ncbi:MAG: PAS domain S-box protein [Cyanosarcina radialis HA8281-LM2]|jgi:PAS domain S-box-containing protein|nr:PAS domain S-box protein [Cyanosarcina radialis HA8281-LM2]